MVTKVGTIGPVIRGRGVGNATISSRFNVWGYGGLSEDAKEAFQQGVITVGNLSKHKTISEETTGKLLSLLVAAYIERMLNESFEVSLQVGMDSLLAEAIDD